MCRPPGAICRLATEISLTKPRIGFRFFSMTGRVDPYLLLLFGLSLLALAPLLAPGYFYSAHDGRHSVFFVTMFDEAIRSGALWPRWAMHHNQGYGYPTFLVQAPLAFYVTELFVLLGAGVTHAVKIAWALGFLAGAWGMYVLVKTWMHAVAAPQQVREDWAHAIVSPDAVAMSAVIAGLLYTYAPYHLLDIYVRAAFAETMLLAWFPWVFLAFHRLIHHGTERGWQGRLAVAAVSYAGLLLTHSFALIAFTPLLIAYVLFQLGIVWWQRDAPGQIQRAPQEAGAAPPLHRGPPHLIQRTLLAAAAGIGAILLAAIFLVPLLVEGPLLVQEEWTQGTYDYTRHWVYWGQYFSPFWGYGYSDDPNGANDGMGFQLGILLILLLFWTICLLFPFLVVRVRHAFPLAAMGEPSPLLLLMLFLLLSTLAVLVSMTPAAAGLWGSIPPLAVIQFPWRLLSLAIFCASALGGLVIGQMVDQAHHGEEGLLVIALLVCFAGFTYSRPAALQPIEPWREDGRAVIEFEQTHPDMTGTTRFVEEHFTTSPMTEQYLAPDYTRDALARFAVLQGEGTVVRHTSLGHAFTGEVEMRTPGTVQIRLYAFPGWQIRVNGEPVPYRVSPPYGLMEIDLPAGSHQLDIWMGTTPARTVGAATSTVTLLVLAGLWLYSRRPHLPASTQR
jgi:hypothetical protein